MDIPFVMEQVYNAPIEKVWQALTHVEAMRIWYFPQLKKFKPVIGFNMEFDDDGSAFKKRWQVTQVVSGKMLTHNWSYQGYPGSSEVMFELFKGESNTTLKLTHCGLASFPNDPHFARHRFEDGWRWIIGEKLKNHLEQAHRTH